MRTVVLSGLYFPFVDFLSSAATAVVLGYGGWLAYHGADLDRHPRRVPRLPVELLRPCPAALAALQHVPLRRRGARQDHRRARRDAGGRGRAGRARARADRRPGLASRTSTSPTAAGRRCCTGSTSTSPPARPSRSSATPAPASRRSRSCSPASTTRPTGGSRSTAPTCATSRSSRCAVSSGSCRRRASCSPARSPRTSPSAAPTRRREEIVEAARAVGADEFIERLEDGFETQLGERGSRLSLGPAPAGRVRARAPRRPAHPDPRRGDELGRHRHRAEDRARAAPAARGPDRVHHRPPSLDDPRRRPDRRARARPDRRAGNARRAARAARPLPVALRRLGRRRRLGHLAGTTTEPTTLSCQVCFSLSQIIHR